MKTIKYSAALIASLAVVAIVWPSAALGVPRSPSRVNLVRKGTAVAYPWVFQRGNDTSRTMAVTSAEEISRKAGFASIPGDVARDAWSSSHLPTPSFGSTPSTASLRAYGHALHTGTVLYGSVSWHTRSIWVNAGPKTISTATVNVYVFDVAANKVVYRKTGVEGRSDEKSNGYKIAADILITPLVTAVSGGPATPQEQRAVQIALGHAYYGWVRPQSRN